jgi:hypothetical protein
MKIGTIIIGTLMVLSFSIGNQAHREPSNEEIMAAIDTGASESVYHFYAGGK